MWLLCFVGISVRIFKKMHSNEDLDCKRFADWHGDKADTGTACWVRLGFSCMSGDTWLQINQVAVYALQRLLRENLYHMMSQYRYTQPGRRLLLYMSCISKLYFFPWDIKDNSTCCQATKTERQQRKQCRQQSRAQGFPVSSVIVLHHTSSQKCLEDCAYKDISTVMLSNPHSKYCS